MSKELDITCPCCQSRLAIDVRTQKVVRWKEAGEVDERGRPKLEEKDWNQAVDKVDDRLGRAVDRFDEALGREQSRSTDLDELFRKANEKLADEED